MAGSKCGLKHNYFVTYVDDGLILGKMIGFSAKILESKSRAKSIRNCINEKHGKKSNPTVSPSYSLLYLVLYPSPTRRDYTSRGLHIQDPSPEESRRANGRAGQHAAAAHVGRAAPV